MKCGDEERRRGDDHVESVHIAKNMRCVFITCQEKVYFFAEEEKWEGRKEEEKMHCQLACATLF